MWDNRCTNKLQALLSIVIEIPNIFIFTYLVDRDRLQIQSASQVHLQDSQIPHQIYQTSIGVFPNIKFIYYKKSYSYGFTTVDLQTCYALVEK